MTSASEAAERAYLDWRRFDDPGLGQILTAALDAFVEHGYHGTTVRDIARRVGLSVPGLYYHYVNKQALLVDLLHSSMHEVLSRSRAAAEEGGENPVARLSALVECIVLFIAHRRDLAFLSAELRSLEPENRAAYVALRDEQEKMVVDAVRQGVDEGSFATGHPGDASRAVITMCLGVANWYQLAGPLGPEKLARRYVGFALGIVGHTGTSG